MLNVSIPNARLMVQGISKENADHYEYTFLVTIDAEARLSTMFARLSEVLATGMVIDFTLTRTTLEQVFINFAKF
jgi:hypothetical protein